MHVPLKVGLSLMNDSRHIVARRPANCSSGMLDGVSNGARLGVSNQAALGCPEPQSGALPIELCPPKGEQANTVAALYVETGGCYFGLPGVDPWDQERDARLYAGPHPVVAHPPCQLWVNFAALNFKRYGGEHNRPGNDGGCFESALAAVRRWGGVLEHPAGSKAWRAFGLKRPARPGWNIRWDADVLPESRVVEFTCEVWQSAYGHKARKRTWLYYVGREPPPGLDWERPAGTHQVGWFDRIKPTLSKRAASSTPPAFRDALINLAQGATP